MDGDQRDIERIPILGSLPGEIVVFQPMAVKDLGPGGTTIETSFPLHLDSLHDLRLTLGPRAIVVKARVIHSRIVDVDHDVVTYSTGLEFVEPSEQVTGAIAEFVAAVKAGRSGA